MLSYFKFYIYRVKRLIQKSGIHILLVLYCFMLYSSSTLQAAQIQQFTINSEINECRSAHSTVSQVYSDQLDFQLKTFSEKEDNTVQKKYLEKLLFTSPCCLDLKISHFQIKVTKDISLRCFSQTDIIYPFHFFW